MIKCLVKVWVVLQVLIHDPCYHQACDSIQNINVFAYEKMVQAAAYVLEYLGQQDDLKAWLYPEWDNNRSDTSRTTTKIQFNE